MILCQVLLVDRAVDGRVVRCVQGFIRGSMAERQSPLDSSGGG